MENLGRSGPQNRVFFFSWPYAEMFLFVSSWFLVIQIRTYFKQFWLQKIKIFTLYAWYKVKISLFQHNWTTWSYEINHFLNWENKIDF